MRFVVISDTHSQPLPEALLEDIRKADAVIHVGDFCDIEILQDLRREKETRAVYGNMDGLDIREILPRQVVFSCENVRIGLVHGEGGPDKLLDRVKGMFKGEKVDAVIFGHSHLPFNEVIDGVLFFNPGSPTDMVRAPFRSYGVIEVKDKSIKGQIVKLK